MATYDEAAKKLNELLHMDQDFNMDQDAINLINENMPTPKFNLFNLVEFLTCVKFEVKVTKEERASSKKLRTWTVSIEVPQGGRSYSYHVQSEGFQPKTELVLLKQPLDRQQTLPWISRTGKALSIGPVERKTTFTYKLEGTMSNNAHDDANPMATSFKKGGELLKPCVQAACKAIHMDATAIQLVNENIPNDFDNMNKAGCVEIALTVVKTDTRSASTLETWKVTVDADESKSGERPQAPHFGYEVQGGKSNKITGHVWLLFNPPFFRPWKAGEIAHLGPSTKIVRDYKYVLTGVKKIQRKT